MENFNSLPEQDPDFGMPGNSSLVKKNVFLTPDNYFEKLPLEISDKIQSGKTLQGKFGLVQNHLNRRLLTAFMVLVVTIAGGILYWNKTQNPNQSETVLSYEDLINSDFVSELDESMLVDAYMSETINTDEDLNEVDNTILEDYLIENNTDITLIINDL
ncbi:MAG: hypothetical protein IPP71_19155 [Bacteroidetes bacterium]|nr:hypothetical protein [Bacteroidota bacterium]